MAIAKRLRWYLDHQGASYERVPHPHTGSSRQSAQAAHVSESQLAKSVLVEDERGYLLVVLPASRRLDLKRLGEQLSRRFELATEAELADIFEDCEPGAVPPLGRAYGIPTALDSSLLHHEDVYFEGGDHRELVRMKASEFAHLLRDARQASFSEGNEEPSYEPVRSRKRRDERLEAGRMHVFSLRSYGAGLRRQPEYANDGHTGMILVKTPELRVVLEAVGQGATLRSHVVRAPATIFVIEGVLDIETGGETFRVGEGEMAALPRNETRSIHAITRSLFVLGISPGQAGEAAGAGTERAEARSGQASRRVLIVAHRTVAGRHLQQEVRSRLAQGPCEFVLLCPSELPFSLAPLDHMRAEADTRLRLEQACDRLRDLGAHVEGVIGDASPMRAIRDLMLLRDFDEIIVSTLPPGLSEWLRLDLPHRVARRYDVPVTHAVSTD